MIRENFLTRNIINTLFSERIFSWPGNAKTSFSNANFGFPKFATIKQNSYSKSSHILKYFNKIFLDCQCVIIVSLTKH
jgi:hypothetical protein